MRKVNIRGKVDKNHTHKSPLREQIGCNLLENIDHLSCLIHKKTDTRADTSSFFASYPTWGQACPPQSATKAWTP